MKDCADDNCTGHGIVYRITLGMTIVSSFLAVLLYRVKSANSPRAVVQNEFFAVKWLALVGVIVGCVYVDNEAISQYGTVPPHFVRRPTLSSIIPSCSLRLGRLVLGVLVHHHPYPA